jgi:hypothetical protein
MGASQGIKGIPLDFRHRLPIIKSRAVSGACLRSVKINFSNTVSTELRPVSSSSLKHRISVPLSGHFRRRGLAGPQDEVRTPYPAPLRLRMLAGCVASLHKGFLFFPLLGKSLRELFVSRCLVTMHSPVHLPLRLGLDRDGSVERQTRSSVCKRCEMDDYAVGLLKAENALSKRLGAVGRRAPGAG